MLKKTLIGMFLFPFLPMAIVDVMIFNQGLNAFDSYIQVNASITGITSSEVRIRRSKSGSQGATYDTILKPVVTYKYLWNDQQMYGERVFLFDAEDTSAIQSNYCEKSSPNPCLSELTPGVQVVAWVNRKQPHMSYLYRGNPILWSAIYFWIKVYLIFSVFATVSVLLISFAKNNKSTNINS